MIERTQAYKTQDGTTHPDLASAQRHELTALLGQRVPGAMPPQDEKEYAAMIVANAAKVVDILSTTPTSKPRARRINGGTKKRKEKFVSDLPSFKDKAVSGPVHL